jgi:putative transposase
MFFEEGKVYHIYNVGNQNQRIFFNDENYYYFIRKLKKYIHSVSHIIAWCLMPNHFHLMVYADERSVKQAAKCKNEISQLSENIRLVLSQYTQGINRQQNLTGSLFRQNTKAKCLNEMNSDRYLRTCFNYIHKNPLEAGLVCKISDWPYSSYADYSKKRNESLCNFELAEEIIGVNSTNIEEFTYTKECNYNSAHIW